MAALPTRLTDPPPKPAWVAITTPEGFVDEVVTSAPLADPEVHVVDVALALPTHPKIWRAMVSNPVIGALIAQCDAEERRIVEQEW